MIKFKYLIHKKTELIITYDEWLKYYKEKFYSRIS
jgi:hypothetical protein